MIELIAEWNGETFFDSCEHPGIAVACIAVMILVIVIGVHVSAWRMK